jgi:uncharacterized protein YjiS (DUF1127 family)
MKYATPVVFEDNDLETSLADAVSNLVVKLFIAVDTWRQRSKTRAQLAGMSSHLLKDIGISRGEALFELNKHFWEA